MCLALLVRAQRAALDESRSASLRKADIDDIEVPRHDGLGEDGAGLASQLWPEVPTRDVREHEQPHRRQPSELGCLHGGRMTGFCRTLALLLAERGLVDENIGFVGNLENRAHRARVSRDDDTAPRSSGT